jgi:predicted nucleic acid-binding protein
LRSTAADSGTVTSVRCDTPTTPTRRDPRRHAAWIDLSRRADTAVKAALRQLIVDEEPLAICGPIITELLAGARYSKLERGAFDILAASAMLPVELDEWVMAGRMRQVLDRRGITGP